MYTIRKRFRFEAAHRLSSSYSKECQQIHGHSYIVDVFISRDRLNEDGMVIDFGLVSTVVTPILGEWDHKLIEVPFNPTAENMAKYLYECILADFSFYDGGHLEPPELKIRVHETVTGWAEYSA